MPRSALHCGTAFLALLLATAAFGEEVTPVRAFRSFDRRLDVGLPQSTVMGLAQDGEGVLWIATLDGVATFDGVEIATLPNNDTRVPATGPVFGLARRQGGGLLAASSRGVHLFDGAAWSLLPFSGAAFGVAEDGRGGLWLYDAEGDLWQEPTAATPAGWRKLSRSGLSGVAALASGGDVGALAGGREGVFRLTDAGPVRVGDEPGPRSVTGLLQTSTGDLWAGTLDGQLFVLARADPHWRLIQGLPWPGGMVRCLAEDRRGRVWVGSLQGGVVFGSRASGWTHWGPENGLKAAGVVSLLADREGTMWIGFNGTGLQQWLGEAWTHRIAWRPDDPYSRRVQVFGITPDLGDGFFAAISGHGLWRWDGTQMLALGPETGLPLDPRFAIEPSPGELWVGGRFGLYESHRGGAFQQVYATHSSFVFALLRSPAGDWFATTSGDGLLERVDGSWRPAAEVNRALGEPSVRALLFRGGELWAGSLKGLKIVRAAAPGAAREAVEVTDPAVPRPVNALLAVDEDVWVAGFGGIAVEHQGVWRRLTLPSEVPGKTVYSLARGPDGAVWAGGSVGVARFADGVWSTYSTHNGLLDDECNTGALWAAPDGSIYVGTMSSLARFDPRVSPLPEPALRCFWRRRPGGNGNEPAQLPARERSVGLAWSAPWLTPHPVEYRVRVPRLAAGWRPAQRERELRLDGLRPGRWDVAVSARRVGGRESDWTPPIEARFVVLPLWWETLGARLSMVLLALAAVAAVVRWRTRRVARRAEHLEAEVTRRTAELRQRNDELQEAHEALADLARRDPLTGLFNRRAIDERLDEVVLTARREQQPVGLLLFDLDYLKPINDRWGHEAGDLVLKHLAACAVRIFRRTDIVARFAGDEFVVLFRGETEERAAMSAERLRASFGAEEIEVAPGERVRATISGGVAAVWPLTENVATGLFAAGDRALYAAKRRGRDCIVRASELSDEHPLPGPLA